MKNLIFDTNVLIRLLRGEDLALRFVSREILHAPISVSYISYIELLCGVKTKHHVRVVDLLVDVFNIDFGSESINRKSFEIFSNNDLNKGLDINDATIAATALENNQLLVTDNFKDFRFIEGLEICSLDEARELFR